MSVGKILHKYPECWPDDWPRHPAAFVMAAKDVHPISGETLFEWTQRLHESPVWLARVETYRSEHAS